MNLRAVRSVMDGSGILLQNLGQERRLQKIEQTARRRLNMGKAREGGGTPKKYDV